MRERGDFPAWLSLFASDHFASHANYYGPVDGFVWTLEAEGYPHTQLKSIMKAV